MVKTLLIWWNLHILKNGSSFIPVSMDLSFHFENTKKRLLFTNRRLFNNSTLRQHIQHILLPLQHHILILIYHMSFILTKMIMPFIINKNMSRFICIIIFHHISFWLRIFFTDHVRIDDTSHLWFNWICVWTDVRDGSFDGEVFLLAEDKRDTFSAGLG